MCVCGRRCSREEKESLALFSKVVVGHINDYLISQQAMIMVLGQLNWA